jgi:hypothetical protein
MIAQYLAAISMTIAALLQLAVNRAPDLREPRASRAARRVLIAGLSLSAFYLIKMLIAGISVNIILLLGAILVGLAEIFFCLAALFPRFAEIHHKAEKT